MSWLLRIFCNIVVLERYAWPKHFEYVDMVKLLTDAAMTAAKDGALARAAAATIAAVGMSHKGNTSVGSMGGGRGLSSGSRPSSAPPASRRVTAYDMTRPNSFGPDPTATAAKLLLNSFRSSGDSVSASSSSKKKKRTTIKKTKKSVALAQAASSNALKRADGIDAQLARTAAKIASLSLPTVNPDIDNIPSFRLSMQGGGGGASGLLPRTENISPTAVRPAGPPIHGDAEGVFIPSGTTPTRSDHIHNEIAKKSQDRRAVSQSVAQFHSTYVFLLIS